MAKHLQKGRFLSVWATFAALVGSCKGCFVFRPQIANNALLRLKPQQMPLQGLFCRLCLVHCIPFATEWQKKAQKGHFNSIWATFARFAVTCTTRHAKRAQIALFCPLCVLWAWNAALLAVSATPKNRKQNFCPLVLLSLLLKAKIFFRALSNKSNNNKKWGTNFFCCCLLLVSLFPFSFSLFLWFSWLFLGFGWLFLGFGWLFLGFLGFSETLQSVDF